MTGLQPTPTPTPQLPLQGGAWRASFGLVAAAAVLSVIWGAALDAGLPDATMRYGTDGLEYVRTAGGNDVLVGQDGSGRFFFVDAAGDLFYDSGDTATGFYIVGP